MRKLRMMSSFKIITMVAILAGGLFFAPQTCAAQGGTGLPPIPGESIFVEQYMTDAFRAYERAGYSSYFEDLAWLWTETDKTRSALQFRMAAVAQDQAQQLQMTLLKVLQINPNQTDALILAGKYHYYQNQKTTALWYFERAAVLRPDYEPAVLSLADYYLAEGRPEQALQAVKTAVTPRAFFRKGVAAIIQNQYHLALGYLLQAELYSGELAAVRNKDLAKVLRTLGDLPRAKVLLEQKIPDRRAGRILNLELRVSCAILEHNTQMAMKLIESGKTNFPEYPRWDFYQCLNLPQDELIPVETLEPEYRAVVYIVQGQEFARQNKFNEAYKCFSEALKVDRRSLIGYYEAGVIQLKRKKMDAAIKLFSKGLEIFPGFIPLLSKRAAAHDQLGLLIEAEGDRAAIRLAVSEMQPAPSFDISRSETEETGILIRHKSGKNAGLWFSEDGNTWTFSPWDRMTFSKSTGVGWVVPTGNSALGTAYRIELKKPNVKWEPPVVVDNALEFRLPYPTRIVVDQLSAGQINKGWMAETASTFSRMALGRFGDGLQTFRIWYGLDDGTWMSGLYRVNRATSPNTANLNYTVTLDKTETNQPLVRLKIATYGRYTDGIRMAVGEVGENSNWGPFQDDYLYQVSPGDGVKNIYVRFSDRTGQVTESRLQVKLDTITPQVKDFIAHSQRFNRYPINWTVTEPVSTKVRVFSERGEWNELVVSGAEDHFYALLPLDSRLCQVVVTDPAGNTSVYSDEELYRQLKEDAEIGFEIVGGMNNTRSRNIQLKPLNTVVRWALSNDLKSWSGWHEGVEPTNWRIGAVAGWQVVYIKYQWLDDSQEIQTNYEAIRVYYEPGSIVI